MHTTGLMVVLAITVMLTVGIACNGPQPATLPETAIATVVPEPSPTKPSIGGATWILELIDGQPTIAGTYATLTLNGPQFHGFDGCNFIGGRHESGKPIINPDGDILPPPVSGTAVDCMSPPGILDQADRYVEAMQQGAKARVVDDRLHIVDRSEEVAAGFRQATAFGRTTHGLGGHQLATPGRRRDLRRWSYDPFVFGLPGGYRDHCLPRLHRRVHGVQRGHPDAVQGHVRLHRAVLEGCHRTGAPVHRGLRVGE